MLFFIFLALRTLSTRRSKNKKPPADVNSELGKSQMERIEKALPADNNIVAHFACQGAMTAEALEQYRDKVEQEPFNDLAQALLDNAMNCSGHPDKMDLLELMRDVQYAIGR